MSPDAIAEALQDVKPALRNQILELADRVDEVVPLLPEAELASTIVSTGVADAGWLVEFATAEQRAACVDLDAWRGGHLSPSRLMDWIDALIEAGEETLVAALDELDLELWVLALRSMARFKVEQAPPGFVFGYDTQDGVVHFQAYSSLHEERLRAILDAARAHPRDYYWTLVHGAMGSSREELEQEAGHVQAGRLNDLGFPDREHAMRAYRPLAPDAAPSVDVNGETEEPGLVAAPPLPQRLAGTGVGRALAELPADRAAERLGLVLAVANTLAVADELPLAEPDSVGESLAKAVRGIDLGLEELARCRDQSPARILDTTLPLDLFRVGATLDPTLRPLRTRAGLDATEERLFGSPSDDGDREAGDRGDSDETILKRLEQARLRGLGDRLQRDWNAEPEELSEADQTFDADGRPK
jgi:hypothetical protein